MRDNNYELGLIPQWYHRTWKNRMKLRKEKGGLYKHKNITSWDLGLKIYIYIFKECIWGKIKKNPSLSFCLKGKKYISTPLTSFFSQEQGGSWDTKNEKKCLVHKFYKGKSECREKSGILCKISHCLMSAEVDIVSFLLSVICRHEYTSG